MELFGSKIKALLDRAARDLYDISNMIRFGLFDESEREILKKCALFYMAVGNDRVPQQVDVTRIDDITFHKIHTDLLPVKRKSDDFDLLKTRELVKTYLEDLCILMENPKWIRCPACRNKTRDRIREDTTGGQTIRTL